MVLCGGIERMIFPVIVIVVNWLFCEGDGGVRMGGGCGHEVYESAQYYARLIDPRK